MLAVSAIIAPSKIAVVKIAGSMPINSSLGRLSSMPSPRPKPDASEELAHYAGEPPLR
ncbi:MAG: hypothetical protein JWM19_7201 [Actinomycetia bacterium]|nr:hypothetical protein [Actinomycetes bacterium]